MGRLDDRMASIGAGPGRIGREALRGLVASPAGGLQRGATIAADGTRPWRFVAFIPTQAHRQGVPA